MSFIKRASATTIASELVSVTPLSAPTKTGSFHIDVKIKDKIPTIYSKEVLRKIKVKKEKAEPEWTEVKLSPVFEMALRIAKNSFYGVLNIKIERTKTPEVSGRIKKVK